MSTLHSLVALSPPVFPYTIGTIKQGLPNGVPWVSSQGEQFALCHPEQASKQITLDPVVFQPQLGNVIPSVLYIWVTHKSEKKNDVSVQRNENLYEGG